MFLDDFCISSTEILDVKFLDDHLRQNKNPLRAAKITSLIRIFLMLTIFKMQNLFFRIN